MCGIGRLAQQSPKTLTVQLERRRSSPATTERELLGDARGEDLGDDLGEPAVPATTTHRAAVPRADSCKSDGPSGTSGDAGVKLPLGLGARLCLGLEAELPAVPRFGTAIDCLLDEGMPVTAMLARRRLG